MGFKVMRTVTAIEWTVAGATFIGAIYAVIRYIIDGYTVASTGLLPVLDTAASGLVWTIILIIGSGLVFTGLIKESSRWKKYGWFILATCRMLQVIGHLVILGPIPFTWMYPATLLAVMIILYFHAGLTVDIYSRGE